MTSKYEQIRQLTADALQAHREDLEHHLFHSDYYFIRVTPRMRRQRRARQIRHYVLGWGDALRATWRAALGRQVLPECDCSDY